MTELVAPPLGLARGAVPRSRRLRQRRTSSTAASARPESRLLAPTTPPTPAQSKHSTTSCLSLSFPQAPPPSHDRSLLSPSTAPASSSPSSRSSKPAAEQFVLLQYASSSLLLFQSDQSKGQSTSVYTSDASALAAKLHLNRAHPPSKPQHGHVRSFTLFYRNTGYGASLLHRATSDSAPTLPADRARRAAPGFPSAAASLSLLRRALI